MTTGGSISQVGNVHLRTPRLFIREWTNSDADEADLLAIESNPNVVQFLEFSVRGKFEIQSRLAAIRQCRYLQPRRLYECAVQLISTGRVIGVCCLAVEDDTALRNQLAYRLHPSSWNQGYAKEAARAMLRFGFEELGLGRIYAVCDHENIASQRVLMALGMKREGNIISKMVKGEQRDWFKYSILQAADE